MKTEQTFTWAKSGDVYRLEKIDTSGGGGMGGGRGGRGGGGMGGGKVTISLTYSEVEKFAIATSWKTEIGGGQMSIETKMSDLTVNARRSRSPRPRRRTRGRPEGRQAGEKGKDDDGEDDDDEKGGEKGGKKDGKK